MNICRFCKVCYEETYCPMCELKIEKDELEEELKEAQEKMDELRDDIKELEIQLEPEREPNINEDDPRKDR